MTQLNIRSNRYGPNSFLSVGVGGVAVDSSVSEFFTLPPGYGDLLVKRVGATISNFSGAYVAPAPAFDGFEFNISDTTGGSGYDIMGAVRFVHRGTQTARPVFTAVLELDERALFGRLDRLYVLAPVIGGAGVTVDLTCFVLGIRINTA